MNSYCDAMGCNCKYHDEKEGCLYFDYGFQAGLKESILESIEEDEDESRN